MGSKPNRTRELRLRETLQAIDAARSDAEVLHITNAFIQSDGAFRKWLSGPPQDFADIAGMAVEITRLGLGTDSTDPDLVALEAVLARASVRNAALLDRTGRHRVYQRPGNVAPF